MGKDSMGKHTIFPEQGDQHCPRITSRLKKKRNLVGKAHKLLKTNG